MMEDSLAVVAPSETSIGPPSTTARRLIDPSVSANTRRAYAGALGRLDAWLDGTPARRSEPRATGDTEPCRNSVVALRA